MPSSRKLKIEFRQLSLGTGRLSPNGSVEFNQNCLESTHRKAASCKTHELSPPTKSGAKNITNPPTFLRRKSSFLRVADLEMDNTSCSTVDSNESFPNFHHPAVDPPPGVDVDPKEKWIALSNGEGAHAPIAPAAVEHLADFCLTTSMNISMWIPESRTDKILKKLQCSDWMKRTFHPGCVSLSESTSGEENEVLTWSGNFKHGLYGSELPAIRAAGIINMSARALVDLLVDSSRVREYNKLSLGRDDLVIFQDSLDLEGPFGSSVTKVMKSETKPPMIRKKLVFISVLHAKELVDGSGYLIVTRAVHHPEEDGANSVIKSEILMGVNLIRKVEGAESSKCLMINVNHIRSPLVPMMVAKRIGFSAAVGFINDIRGLCT